MGTTQPIRNKEDLKLFLEFYEKVEPSERNYALVSLGLNTALRISDILKLRWKDSIRLLHGIHCCWKQGSVR